MRDVCGIHAQVMAAAELSLCARVEGITQQDVREALWTRRSLVKAWTLRGTLHLHPADELALWYAARRAVAGQSQEDELEAWRDPAGVLHPALGRDDVRAIRVAVRDALDGRCLLREELAAEVVRRVGTAPRERLLSGFAFFLGDVCQGPPQGNKVTFVRPDQWIEGWREMDEGDALREVCRRYLWAYGPARPNDFRDWFASREFTPSGARELFAALGSELEELDVDGRTAYALAGDTEFPEAPRSVKLVPEYDVYVMGFRERDELVPLPVRERIAAHSRGKYEGPAGVRFMLIDGVAQGLWERKKRGRRIELTVAPVVKTTRGERAQLVEEAERIGAFLGLEPALTVE